MQGTVKNKKEGIAIRKEQVPLSPWADGIILSVECFSNSTKELLGITNEFSKAAGYDVKIQK